jgi:hypothetical protein
MANRYPRGRNFIKKSFRRFFTTDTIAWFAERGVELKTEPDGRMFPVSNSSEMIINCLMREADKYGVELLLNIQVNDLKRDEQGWTVNAFRGAEQLAMQADFVCIATGGYPKQEQYAWMASLGHQFVPPSPSLFTFNAPGHPITKLMGVAVEEAEVKIPELKHKEKGPVMITHWGLSGPAVIRLSAWLAKELESRQYKAGVVINWLPEFNENSFRDFIISYRDRHGSIRLRSRSPFGLPQRLWEFLSGESNIGDEKWAEVSASSQNKLIRNVVAYQIRISGKTTFKEEFVTAGGVSLLEVDPDTMQSRKQPSLYFAGEVLDVDGITGGYNFQHAWTSGFNAAQDIAQKSLI